MIKIQEQWDEKHGLAYVQAIENGYIIDDESFTVGHGASVDNRSVAHEILILRVHENRPNTKIIGFFTQSIITFDDERK